MRRSVGIFFSFSPHLSWVMLLCCLAQLSAFLLVDRCACVMAVWSPTWDPADLWQLLSNSQIDGYKALHPLDLVCKDFWICVWILIIVFQGTPDIWSPCGLICHSSPTSICIFLLCLIPFLNRGLISWSHWSSLGLCLSEKQNIWSHLGLLKKAVRLTDH